MNFIDTLTSADLVLATEAVPLIIGESGIGKTDLAKELARKKNWSLITIDANLLKEGEIGGLPTVKDNTTVYAVHHKLKELEKALMLLYLEEKSHKEMAEIIGITETNIATKIGRIKTRLKLKFLQKEI